MFKIIYSCLSLMVTQKEEIKPMIKYCIIIHQFNWLDAIHSYYNKLMIFSRTEI